MAEDAPFRVDFVIGGTQKGGTTALAHFLGQHPEICLPKKKEAHFFDAADYPDDAPLETLVQRYRALFPEPLTGRLRGDATPVYMYLPEVPERVWRYNPDTRWILLLRDPVERAISHYQMECAQGHETLSLSEAIAAESDRLRRDRDNRKWNSSMRLHSYTSRGYYTEQLRRVRRWFGSDAILILTSGELRHRHAETLQRVYRFLGVHDTSFIPEPEAVFSARQLADVPAPTRFRLQRAYLWERLKLRWQLGRRAYRSLRHDFEC